MNTADNLAQATGVDAISDRFETAWKAGERPRIEEYLTTVKRFMSRIALCRIGESGFVPRSTTLVALLSR